LALSLLEEKKGLKKEVGKKRVSFLRLLKKRKEKRGGKFQDIFAAKVEGGKGNRGLSFEKEEKDVTQIKEK